MLCAVLDLSSWQQLSGSLADTARRDPLLPSLIDSVLVIQLHLPLQDML